MGSEESRQPLDDARARASALVVLIDALCLAISRMKAFTRSCTRPPADRASR